MKQEQSDITSDQIKPKPAIEKKHIILSIILIITLGLVVYGNSLKNEFIWDDEYLIEKNAYVTHWSYIPRIFTEDIFSGAQRESRSYRPTQILSYMIDHYLWKLNPFGYHLTNVLFHILAALSLYYLIYAIFNDNLLALWTGLLFVAHPVHTEAVTYVAGRADPLALLFMLLCFIFYVKGLSRKRAGTYLLMLLSYALALLSRENALILPVLLLLYHYSFKKGIKVGQFFSIVGLACIYLLLRASIQKTFLPVNEVSFTLFERIPGFFVAVTNYIKILFLPLNLHMEYGERAFRFADPKAISGAGALLAMSIAVFKIKKKSSCAFFSIAWFLIALLPVSNLYPLNAYMAEHWLYVPSIGFFLIAARAITSLVRAHPFKIYPTICAICLLAFYSSLTIKQNSFWHDPISFYERTLRYTPNSSRVHYNLGITHKDGGHIDRAIKSYKRAIIANPKNAEAFYNLGHAYKNLSRYEEAAYATKKAIRIDPEYADAYNNLGIIYAAMNKKEDALAAYKKAIEIKPDYAQAYNNLGITYAAMDKNEDAAASYRKTIEINPDYAEAHNNLGIVYAAMNKREEAVDVYRKGIEINPNYAELFNNLGAAYAGLNNKEEAVASYKKAIEIKPDYAQAYNNLGITYAAMDKNEDAAASYKKATEIAPDYAKAYKNLSFLYLKQKQYQQAIEYYEKAKRLGLTDPRLAQILEPYR